MSTIEPPDDDFERLIGTVFEDDSLPADVVDVTALDDTALMDLFADTRERLKESEGMYSDLQSLGSRESTQEERDLHSLRLACLTELRRRGLS